MSADPPTYQATERVGAPEAAAPTAAGNNGPLEPGTRLGEFRIERVLGIGGFGIVYQATDLTLDRQVAIKEYMPTALATRTADGTVAPMAPSVATTFALGRDSFVNEAKLLARFDHPSLVKVLRFWEERGTAYMAMPYYQGQTLAQARQALNGVPDPDWLRSLLQPLLGAVETLHEQRVYHRDIAPDNILLVDGGQPVLLDLGAARRVISDRTQALTTILKPKYAPIEQYGQSTDLAQGPWTDLYALAAVLYFCITGSAPPEAAARAVQDHYAKLSDPRARVALPGVERLGPHLLQAIDWALNLHPRQRPQSVAEFKQALTDGTPTRAAPTKKSSGALPVSALTQTRKRKTRAARAPGWRKPLLMMVPTALAALVVIKHQLPGASPARRPHPPAPAHATAPLLSLKTTSPALAASGPPTVPLATETTASATSPADTAAAHEADNTPKPAGRHRVAAAGAWRSTTPQTAHAMNGPSAKAANASSNTPSAQTAAADASAQAVNADASPNATPPNLYELRKLCIDRGETRVLVCMNRYCNQPENATTRMCKNLRRREFNLSP